MKSNTPRSWFSLPQSERDKVNAWLNEQYHKQVNAEEADMQEIWMKLCCILLHDAFGFGEGRLLQFLGNWKRIYRMNAAYKCKEEQSRQLEAKMKILFPKSGFPEDFVKEMKEKDYE